MTDKLLLIDAEPEGNKSLWAQLERLNTADIDTATDCKQAKEALSLQRYPVILIDRRTVAQAAAWTAEIRRLEREEGWPPAVVLLITDRFEPEKQAARADCRSIGINDIIAAPVRSNELKETLLRWLPEADAEKGLLNKDTVEELLELDDGRHEMVCTLLEMFRQDTPLKIEQIRALREKGDLRLASEVAHSLKSASLSMGMAWFAKWCEELEQACLEDGTREADYAFGQLETAYKASCAAWENLLPGRKVRNL
ncbi:hypothetical protein AWM70_02940 [Paenibacillus yonginensis]|uniref:HPt domain-containing protein n=1 Tax=Paenibacillus yonginensis TaxID=1462996 RepID=A0A1B1MWU6_9BACL|nr:response regulator [Paenibacillus yonginensis]ANS73662.1 hypothetical protein AWM70_02940 [Paenibacillus yonginensis]